MGWNEIVTRPARSMFTASVVVGVALVVVPWIARAVIGARLSDLAAPLDMSKARHDGGFAWRIVVSPEEMLPWWSAWAVDFPTNQGANNRSRMRLFADDQPLGPPHASHSDIRSSGDGRFSHWRKNLHFSAPDDADPRTDGRRYRIESPIETSRELDLLALVASLCGVVVLWRCAPMRARTAIWRERWFGDTPAPPLAAQSARAPLPRAWSLALVVIWIACAATAVWSNRAERDAYLLGTVPTLGYSDHTNSLIGYSTLLDGSPRHSENIQTWDHLAMFNGAFIAADMYANRPLFPFLVSCAAWLLGVSGASLAVNLAAWAVGVWAAVRVGAELAQRPAAGLVAGVLACLGPGWWFHLGDYSAHLLSFTMSALALLVLLRSRVWAARQPAEVHAAIGCTLVVAALAYNSGLFFLAAYVLLAIWRNRWWHVLLAAAAPIVAQRLWPPLLNFLGKGNFDYYAVERGLLSNALAEWPEALRQGDGLETAWEVFIDGFVAYGPLLPLVMLGALAPLLGGVVRSSKLGPAAMSGGRSRPVSAGAVPDTGAVVLMLMAIAMPIAAVVVYSPTATARGYLVFGGATAAWALMGLMVARLKPGAWRGIGSGLLLLGMAAQLWFVTRHAGGDARTVKLFTWGSIDWSWSALQAWRAAPVTEVLGLTGEPRPALAGGSALLADCGAYTGGQQVQTLVGARNFIQAGHTLVVRSFVLLPLVLWIHLLIRAGLMHAPWRAATARPPKLAGVIIVALLIGPPLGTWVRRGGPVHERTTIHDRSLPSSATTAVLEVEVDPAILLRLERAVIRAAEASDEDSVDDLVAACMTGFGWSPVEGEGVQIEIEAGGTTVARFDTTGVGRGPRPIDLRALVAGLRREAVIRVIARRPDGIQTVASWQRGDRPGRTLTLDGVRIEPAESLPMPLFELRLHPRNQPFSPVLLLY